MKAQLQPALFALDMAIQTEKDGRAFYLRAAATTQDPRGRELFSRIANDEMGHLAMLEERKELLLAEGKWAPFKAELKASVPSTPIFAKSMTEAELNAHTSDLSALRMAYLLERDAVEFYARAAAQTNDAEGKKMYRALVEMENTHQTALETEYKLISEQFQSFMGFAPF